MKVPLLLMAAITRRWARIPSGSPMSVPATPSSAMEVTIMPVTSRGVIQIDLSMPKSRRRVGTRGCPRSGRLR
jgi:hypothetical protein